MDACYIYRQIRLGYVTQWDTRKLDSCTSRREVPSLTSGYSCIYLVFIKNLIRTKLTLYQNTINCCYYLFYIIRGPSQLYI